MIPKQEQTSSCCVLQGDCAMRIPCVHDSHDHIVGCFHGWVRDSPTRRVLKNWQGHARIQTLSKLLHPHPHANPRYRFPLFPKLSPSLSQRP